MSGHRTLSTVPTGLGKPGVSWKIKVLFDGLVTADNKARRERHAFWWTPEFESVVLYKVKKYPKTRIVLKIFENDS